MNAPAKSERKGVKLLIAGNYQQARDYMREHGLSQMDARYVDRIEHVAGMRGSEVILCGEHWLNPLSDQMDHVRALTTD